MEARVAAARVVVARAVVAKAAAWVVARVAARAAAARAVAKGTEPTPRTIVARSAATQAEPVAPAGPEAPIPIGGPLVGRAAPTKRSTRGRWERGRTRGAAELLRGAAALFAAASSNLAPGPR